MRIAFPEIPSRNWRGGFYYLHNLFSSLNKYKSEIEPVLIAGESAHAEDLKIFRSDFGSKSVLVHSAFDRENLRKNTKLNLVRRSDPEFFRESLNCRFDLIFENATYLGRRPPIPILSWFPDLQHRRLPQYFSLKEYWRREIGFRLQAATRHVLVSSFDTRNDCLKFYPGLSQRIHVARFAVPPVQRTDPEITDAVLKKYALETPFLFVPNHFWAHKNHGLIIEMLRVAKSQGTAVTVAMCGSPKDPRDPGHMDRLVTRAAQSDVSKDFRYLGEIPKQDMVALMTASFAVANPSYFEGWSTTVEEAIAFGKRLIVSDIPVHREQCPEGSLFFAPDSPEEFLAQVRACLASPPITQPQELLFKSQESRVQDYANSFAAAARRTCDEFNLQS